MPSPYYPFMSLSSQRNKEAKKKKNAWSQVKVIVTSGILQKNWEVFYDHIKTIFFLLSAYDCPV